MGKKKEDAPAGAPLWMVTFSDLMTQLLCFFVFLSSVSTFDINKANVVLASFQSAFGTFSEQIQILQHIMNPRPSYRETANIPGWESAFSRDFTWRNFEQTVNDITAYIQAQKKGDDVKLNLDRDSVTISITSNLLFESGTATLKRQSYPVLYEIALSLRKIDNPILIEGHTDPDPIDSEIYPSNWELSVARAMAVANFLMEKGKVDEHRFRVSGRAQYKPVTPNITIEGKQRNRRVDIILLAIGEPDK